MEKRLLIVIFFLSDVEKLECRSAGKKFILHHNFVWQQLPQSAIDIPATGSVRYYCTGHELFRQCPAGYGSNLTTVPY
jgi:hypothetical protein